MPKTIPLDIQRIKQVLNNLMSNAMKYTPDGGSVTVSAFVHEPAASITSEVGKLHLTLPSPLPENAFPPNKRSLVITVSDSGIGIADDHCRNFSANSSSSITRRLFQTSKARVLALLSPKES
jgi:signal transduction histidine kinase